MISTDAYFMGRVPPDIEVSRAAVITTEKANRLIAVYKQATNDMTPRVVVCGWSPNKAVDVASLHHHYGRAIDISDPEGNLDDWCQDHLRTLEQIGLWMEHPATTRGHCHVQTVEPQSGRRIFNP